MLFGTFEHFVGQEHEVMMMHCETFKPAVGSRRRNWGLCFEAGDTEWSDGNKGRARTQSERVSVVLTTVEWIKEGTMVVNELNKLALQRLLLHLIKMSLPQLPYKQSVTPIIIPPLDIVLSALDQHSQSHRRSTDNNSGGNPLIALRRTTRTTPTRTPTARTRPIASSTRIITPRILQCHTNHTRSIKALRTIQQRSIATKRDIRALSSISTTHQH
jgi:hypothetical protein